MGCTPPYCMGTGSWCGCNCRCCPPEPCYTSWTYVYLCGSSSEEYELGCDCGHQAPLYFQAHDHDLKVEFPDFEEKNNEYVFMLDHSSQGPQGYQGGPYKPYTGHIDKTIEKTPDAPMGSCMFYNWWKGGYICDQTTQYECNQNFGIWTEGESCDPNNKNNIYIQTHEGQQGLGRCEYPGGCIDHYTLEECSFEGSTWTEGAVCGSQGSQGCPQGPQGRCVYGPKGEYCVISTQCECSEYGIGYQHTWTEGETCQGPQGCSIPCITKTITLTTGGCCLFGGGFSFTAIGAGTVSLSGCDNLGSQGECSDGEIGCSINGSGTSAYVHDCGNVGVSIQLPDGDECCSCCLISSYGTPLSSPSFAIYKQRSLKTGVQKTYINKKKLLERISKTRRR